MSQKINRIGQVFGRLTVIAASKSRKGRTLWVCQCVCGQKKTISREALTSGFVQSCGCLGRERRLQRNTKHGQARRGHQTPEWVMWNAAKQRSKRNGTTFEISLEDIKIPAVCPVFGTPMHQNSRIFCDDSPSLDCKKPELGYISGNVWVISWRANRLKSDATLDELKAITRALEELHG